ncbi:MAG: hypothetical protein MGG37_14610 [Trichodesmium sp. MAG_R01]|nr:hypothetical protein [Trichodesmium sp. MAG_R01]
MTDKPTKAEILTSISNEIADLAKGFLPNSRLCVFKIGDDYYVTLDALELAINNEVESSLTKPEDTSVFCGKEFVSLKVAFHRLIYTGKLSEYDLLYNSMKNAEDVTDKLDKLETHLKSYLITIWA